MDPQSIGLLIAIIVLMFLSGFFSATETAYSSMNRVKLKSMAQDGNKKAKRALLISENYDKFLTANLIGNNVVNIASASLATMLFTKLIMQEEVAVTVSTIVMTLVTLIFGEISPKSLAKESPENFAMAVSCINQVLIIILSPLSWIFIQWKKLLMFIFKPKKQDSISEAELITIVDEATTDGAIDAQEGELIRSAIEFNELTVRDIFTPRVDVVSIDINTDKETLRNIFIENGFSRLPVFEGDIDHVVGILHEKDFYNNYFNEQFNIKNNMSGIICVTLTATLSSVLKMLQKSKTHMAVVIDEYGGTAGIVTLEDIIEELVGEIWDEHDEITEEIIAVGDDEYQIDGTCDIEDMFDMLEQEYDSDELEVTTASGWVIDKLGYIPKVGEEFTHENLLFKVLDADNRKIEKIYVKITGEKKKEENNFLDKLFIKDEKDSKKEKEDKQDEKPAVTTVNDVDTVE